MDRGNPEAILTEPTISRLGNWLFPLISPSATPISDQLKAVFACVAVLVRTYPMRTSLSQALLNVYVCASEKTRKPESLGLENPGILPAGFNPLPGNVTVCWSSAKKKRAASLLFGRTM